MVDAKLIDKQGNMEAVIDKYFKKGRELESYNRFSITRADQHDSSILILQILSKFLHRFHLVDLIAGSAADSPLQPSDNI